MVSTSVALIVMSTSSLRNYMLNSPLYFIKQLLGSGERKMHNFATKDIPKVPSDL